MNNYWRERERKAREEECKRQELEEILDSMSLDEILAKLRS